MERDKREKGKCCFFGKAFFTKERFMIKDERGQMSIDFLAGISLFLVTLLFMVHFIPGIFVPFQSETIDLNSVAYRTSVILVEDPGWWDNGTSYGGDWENQDVENVSRIGLAIDKEHPNMLSMSKIDFFKKTTNENLTDMLCLYRDIGGTRIDYRYNITIEDPDKNILAARGEIPPDYGDVSSMKRKVWTQIGLQAYIIDGDLLEGASSPTKALFYINKSDVGILDDDICIAITNFNFTGLPGQSYDGIKLANSVTPAGGKGFHISGGNTFTDPGGYASLLNGETEKFDYYHGELTPTPKWDINHRNDTLEIFMTKSVFVNQSITIDGTADIYIELQFGEGIEVDPDFVVPAGTPFKPISAPAYKPTELTIQVWL